MSNLIKLILSMSLSGSILILMIMVLRPILKNRFSKAWQYYVWIIVVLRLLIPFTPEAGLINELVQKEAVFPSLPSEAPAVTNQKNPYLYSDSDLSSLPDTKLTASGNKRASLTLSQFWEAATLIWITGIICLLFIKILRYLQFTYMVRLAPIPVKEEEVAELLKKTAAELKIRKDPELYINDYISSPMMIDLFKPAVYLTKDALSMGKESLSFVLRHELMHYKRHDLWYKWICELTLCVHWFNPFVKLMSRQIHSQCETSCDEAVARDFSSYEKLAYGNMLINAATINTKYQGMLSTTLYEDKKNVKERLQSVLNAGRKSNRTMTLSFIMVLLLCAVAAYLGTYSEDSTNPDSNSADSNPTVMITDAASQPDQADTTADNNPVSNQAADTDSTNTEEDTVSEQEPAPAMELPLIYENTDYGFRFALPESWKGFTVYEEDWQGTAISGDEISNVAETGPVFYIRHPDWTKENPRQDIPIMVFTSEQWELVQSEEIAVSAAPVPPYQLGSNSKYVFALPARYNFAFPTGYEEVEQIISNNALQPTENFK